MKMDDCIKVGGNQVENIKRNFEQIHSKGH